MRTLALIFVLMSATASATAGTTKATLRVVDLSPLTVRGTGFEAEQSVRVVVRQAGRVVGRRSVRTGLRGGFTSRFAAVTFHRCGADLAVTATASSGLTATAKLPLPDCPPPG